MSGAAQQRPPDFASAFEASFARLQVCVETACSTWHALDWAEGVAAAIWGAFEFAAVNPATANRLTNDAVTRGDEGLMLYERLIAYLAGLLRPGRGQRPENAGLPPVIEYSLAGGVTFLVARRLDQGRGEDLPALAPEAVQFVLAPYLGPERARRTAATSQNRHSRL